MPQTSKAAQQRIAEFLQASRALPPMPSRLRERDRAGGSIIPAQWGADWSRRYRKAHPHLTELFDTLDQLRAEHLAANAKALEARAFKRELRRLAKL